MMLDLSLLTVAYGAIEALRGVSLHIAEGQFVAVIGPNGAGKSTLLNAVSGLVPVRSGSLSFCGRALVGVPAHDIARAGLIQVPEGRQILGPLSVEENLELGRLALGSRRKRASDALARIYAMFPKLKERRRQEAGSLSGGEQQMLAIGRALMGEPRLLVLDEPSLGLAPRVVQDVFAVLTRLNAEGLAILLVEQNARRALAATQYAYVLEHGVIVHQGRSATLANDPKIINLYLGQETETAIC